MARGAIGRSKGRTSPAGRSITSRTLPPIQIGSTPRKRRVGSVKSFSAPTTAVVAGIPPAIDSSTRARPARTYGTTARRIRGSSRASGTSSRRCTIRTSSMPALKTRRFSGRPTAARIGRSYRVCERIVRPVRGNRAPAVCAYIRSCSTRAIRIGCSRRFPPPAPFAATTPARRGGRSIEV